MLTYDMHNYADSQAATAQHTPPIFIKSSRHNEKYSLRQRDKRKCNNNDIYSHSNEPQTYIPDNNNNNNNNNNNESLHIMQATNTEIESNPLLTTYRTKRACLAPANTTIKHAKVLAKTKTKAAPLSKYRRKTANARERTRMREINTAFEQLRQCVPPTIIGEDPNSTNEKLTKITTLRLAMKYIQTLSQALENPQAEKELLEELDLAGDLRFRLSALEFQQQQELLEPQNNFIEEKNIQITNKIMKSTQKSKSIGKSKSVQTKVIATKTAQKLKKNGNKTNKINKYKNSSLSPASTSSAYSSQYSNASFSSPASTISETSNTSTAFDNGNVVGINQIDINHMLLESDGESLHLSEHCLSPLSAQNSNNLFHSSTLANSYTNFDTSMSLSTLENPLELSLRLLDPTVTDQQQPSACISPLSSLDTLPPYCDLLSVDFPEHSSLDMFLT